MPHYLRNFRPGGTFFFTLCTYQRRPVFAAPANVDLLRATLRTVMTEWPFEIMAGVVLPDHIHWIWVLPENDADFSRRMGRTKALFSKGLGGGNASEPSRQRHRESDVWQRRFWEHTVRDVEDLNAHLNYIHYNPVKHRLATCPHQWAASSFSRFVAAGAYRQDWCCVCDGQTVGSAHPTLPYPTALDVME